MPELPEVETLRSRLDPVLAGRKIERAEILDPRLVNPLEPPSVARRIEGERIMAVERRGKYVVVRFESGAVLLIHLRMTGTLIHTNEGAAGSDPHRRAVVNLDDGSDVVYRDVRRFGTWRVLEPDDVEPYLSARLGREPLDAAFTARRLAERLQGRRTSVKAALLDQRTLAGMGNIYVDEALWRARIHPLRPAGGLDLDEVRRLHRGIRAALTTGIRRQGATLRDYRMPDGSVGAMQHEFKVYGRDGEPCERCGAPIEKTRAGGRGTWYCPRCQPLGEPAR